MRKLFAFISIILAVLFVILLANMYMFKSKQLKSEKTVEANFPDSSVISRLAKVCSFPTSSSESDSVQRMNFDSLHVFLKENFPLVHNKLDLIKFDGSLLFLWKGSDTTLAPVVLLSHSDVVPANDSLLWKYPPFSSKTDADYIYGRGTLDDKSSMTAILEAVENLLSKDFRPKASIYIAIGHDEEIGGIKGALSISTYLQSKNIKASMVLDEGGYIVKDVIPGLNKPLALIGIAEKGYLSLKISTKNAGGHASMPPAETAIDKVAKALVKIKLSPFKSTITTPVSGMFDYIGPEMPFSKKIVFANRWLFKPLILAQMENKSSTNASVRTSIATTVFHSGYKDNVLPSSAEAVINFRILPGQTTGEVTAHVKDAIADTSIKIEIDGHANNPSAISDTASEGFKLIQRSISEVFPEVLVAPYLVISTSDAKHFSTISDNIFRFCPIRIKNDDLKRFHGTDERLELKNYAEMILFYENLIRNVK